MNFEYARRHRIPSRRRWRWLLVEKKKPNELDKDKQSKITANRDASKHFELSRCNFYLYSSVENADLIKNVVFVVVSCSGMHRDGWGCAVAHMKTTYVDLCAGKLSRNGMKSASEYQRCCGLLDGIFVFIFVNSNENEMQI